MRIRKTLLLSVMLHLMLMADVFFQKKSLPKISVRASPSPVRIKVTKRISQTLSQNKTATQEKISQKAESAYKDYLPRHGELVFNEAPIDEDQSGTSVEVGIMAIQDLTALAREVMTRISIPAALKRGASSAVAFIKLSKQNNHWRIQKVEGNSYFRVLLYEVLLQLTADNTLNSLLANAPNELRSVDVQLEFCTNQVAGFMTTGDPWKFRTNLSQIVLTYTHTKLDAKWSMLMPSPLGGIAPNIVGIGKFLYDISVHNNMNEDPEVRALIRSPVFAKPIK